MTYCGQVINGLHTKAKPQIRLNLSLPARYVVSNSIISSTIHLMILHAIQNQMFMKNSYHYLFINVHCNIRHDGSISFRSNMKYFPKPMLLISLWYSLGWSHDLAYIWPPMSDARDHTVLHCSRIP